MNDYQTLLAFQPILTPRVEVLVEKLKSGELSTKSFHNKKAYAKRKGNLILVLEYTISWEICNNFKEKI